VSTADLFQHRSFDLSLGGRYSLASRYDIRGSRREFACRTSRVSPYQMHVAVPVLGPVGERVVSYFGDFGSLDGWITDIAEGGFLLNIELPRQRREKFVAQLAWLKKRQDDVVADARAQKRIVPKNPHSTLIFGDETTLNCLVIDISPSGVAVSADVDPEIGTRLAVGRSVGYVVRKFAEGFAVQFACRKPGAHHLPAAGPVDVCPASRRVCGERRARSAPAARRKMAGGLKSVA
jgi:hypothetical protein